MARKSRAKPKVKQSPAAVTSATKPLNQGGSDGVSVERVPKPHAYVSNLPRDPLTGLPAQPPPKPPKTQAKSLSQAASDAFHAVGGESWLRKQAREYPKEFMALMARVAGEEGGLGGGASYVPLPIPVEQRELVGGTLEPIPQPVADDPLGET